MDRVCKLELSARTPADALTITTGQRSIDQINTLAHSTVVISVQNVSHRIGSMHLCCKISLKEEGSKNMNRSNHRQNKGQVGEGVATVVVDIDAISSLGASSRVQPLLARDTVQSRVKIGKKSWKQVPLAGQGLAHCYAIFLLSRQCKL